MLQVCDALLTPYWSEKVGVIADPAEDGFRPGDTIDWATYVARQREPHAWGGQREIGVMQELLGVRLVLYGLNEQVRRTQPAILPAIPSANAPSGVTISTRRYFSAPIRPCLTPASAESGAGCNCSLSQALAAHVSLGHDRAGDHVAAADLDLVSASE